MGFVANSIIVKFDNREKKSLDIWWEELVTLCLMFTWSVRDSDWASS